MNRVLTFWSMVAKTFWSMVAKMSMVYNMVAETFCSMVLVEDA